MSWLPNLTDSAGNASYLGGPGAKTRLTGVSERVLVAEILGVPGNLTGITVQWRVHWSVFNDVVLD